MQGELKTGDHVCAAGKVKTLRHDADDRRFLSGQIERSAHDVSIAREVSLPQTMTDDGYRSTIREIFFGRKRTAQHWTSPDCFEEVG